MILKPRAKVNLHLEVLNKRPDGYHNLRSLFLKTTLDEELDVTLKPRAVFYQLECRALERLDREHDILYKAYRFYSRLSGERFGLEIKLKKRIPMEAGLGGGSADAAALLKQLNAVFKAVDDEELIKASVEVGADVPFFMSPAKAAVVEGVGEKILPLPPKKFYIVIMKPELSVATAGAFRALERGAAYRERVPSAQLRESWHQERSGLYFNSFETIFESKHAYINKYKALLKKAGACHAGLTGSGSCIIGLFTGKEQAEAAMLPAAAAAPLVIFTESLD
jgi:4-diphosphocytidyl-2-C-methyl-D-erythritol kinase